MNVVATLPGPRDARGWMNSMGRQGDRARVVIFGLGTVGKTTLRLCGMRPWIELAGAIIRTTQPMAGALGAPKGFKVSPNADSMLDEVKPDVALIATRSTVADILPDIERCMQRGIHVICTSEELVHPAVAIAEAGVEIDSRARKTGVVIAATGINPGFIFDALPLTIAGAAWDIERIYISRSLDASVFGSEVHRSLGIGYNAEDFIAALASHTIRGHIGFEESANVVAGAMGRTIERFEEHIEPVFATREHVLRDHRIELGQTAGVTQHAIAWVDSAEWLEFDLSLHIAPKAVGMQTRDRIRIEGENTLEVTIEPGTQAVLTTAARLVNTIPGVLRAAPGLYSAADLLPAAPWLGSTLPPQEKSV